MHPRLPEISVIIEWENARHSKEARASDMLQELSRQIAAVRPRMARDVEIIMLHDAEAIDAEMVRTMAQKLDVSAGLEVRIVPTTGLNYYTQKNHGAQIATRDVLVFVDTDVVPEPGWLESLLSERARSNASIVGGSTYINPSDFLSRAFSLFWFFPQRSDDDSVRSADIFYANNFSVPRESFLARPFPHCDTMRGQCVLLADDIVRTGGSISIVGSARVSHPPPNGWVHLFKRAFAAGHDFLVLDRARGNKSRFPQPLSAIGRARRNLAHSYRSISAKGRSIGMGPFSRMGAGAVATTYFVVAAMGEMVAVVNPGFIRRHFVV